MRKLYLIALLLFTNSTLHAQELHVDWTKFYGGDSCHSGARTSIKTSDDGMLLAGYTYCNNKGDIPTTTNYQLGENLMIAKADINGQLSWVKVFGGTNDEEAFSACETMDGGFAVLGITFSSDGDIDSFKGVTDLWLIKLDEQGNLLWKKTYGSPFNDVPVSITETPQGELVIFAGSNGSGGDIPSHYGGLFSFDWVIIKTDAQGNKIWCKNYGGTDDDEHAGNIIVIGNNYYLASGSLSKDIDCYDTSWFGTNITGANFHLLKIDTSGNLVWDKSYGGSEGEVVQQAIFDNRDTSIVMSGASQSFDYMVNNPQHLSTIWMLKTDTSGIIKWSKSINQSGIGYASSRALTCTDSGYLLLENMSATIPAPGATDLILWLVDTSGTIQTNKIWGGLSHESAAGIISFGNNYRAIGYSVKPPFTEGGNSGQQGNGTKAFISAINFWPTKIDITKVTDALKIYPNPAQAILYVEPSPDMKLINLTIINSIGQIVYNEKKVKTKLEITINGWPSGVYIIQVENRQNKKYAYKFTKN
jgi:hypothetical protein